MSSGGKEIGRADRAACMDVDQHRHGPHNCEKRPRSLGVSGLKEVRRDEDEFGV
jgi:hypothetical protein